MQSRAALYLRVSTSRQAENELSIPDQRRQAETYCERKGWSVAREFEERGASATDDKRPVFQEMIDAASRPDRDFDIIVVHSYSRFFRDAFQLEFYLRRLQKHGVKVVSITQETGDDPMSQLVRKILALFDEYQSKENGKHTLRAMKENARQGFWNGSRPPYGYCAAEVERRGDKSKKRLTIEAGEAEIVRTIFALHLEGRDGAPLGVKAIADHLNRKGLHYRGGRRFSTGLVHRILTRETYTGRCWFNQLDSKSREVKPKDEWIEVEVPPIIENPKFARVRASLAARSPKKIAPRIVTSPVLLTGLARCATCGGGMQLRTGKNGRYRYYTCSTCARLGKAACKGRSVPMALLDTLVLDHLARRVFTPQRLRLLLAEHEARGADGAATWAAKAKAAERQLREADVAMSRLYEMVERGVAPLDDTLSNRLSQLRQRRDEALRLKGIAERHKQIPRSAIDPDQIDEFCEEMRKQLLETPIDTRKSYLRLFVDLIEVDDTEVRMFGPKGALERGLRQTAERPDAAVPSFVQDWRPQGETTPDLMKV
jgi:site-specific DNA recombinase